jgi:hypothetical protein
MKMKMNGQRKAQSVAARFSCCVAGYFVPGLDEDEIVRMTAAVVDLDTGKLVEHYEFWSDEDDMDLAVEDAHELAKQYDAPIFFVSRPVALQECPCGCDEYVVHTVTKRDLMAMSRGWRAACRAVRTSGPASHGDARGRRLDARRARGRAGDSSRTYSAPRAGPAFRGAAPTENE